MSATLMIGRADERKTKDFRKTGFDTRLPLSRAVGRKRIKKMLARVPLVVATLEQGSTVL